MAASLPTVAVIGVGAQGLVCIKNLLEVPDGFEVTGFERNSWVGGLWKFTELDQTSALETTIANISKERSCFTDFPFPDGTSAHPTAAELEQYMDAYAKHFDVYRHIRFNALVSQIERDDAAQKWIVTSSTPGPDGEQKRDAFDKVVIATGGHTLPTIPSLPGQEAFKGQIMHSQTFKRPAPFKGKRVMVVGLGNTAGDTASLLAGVADKVYLAHRQGGIVVPRILPGGKFIDHAVSYRKTMISYTLSMYAPALGEKLMNAVFHKMMNESFPGIKAEWKLLPAPSLVHQVPTISDTLIPCLHDGSVVSTAAPAAVLGDDLVELQDGTRVAVDAIIWCTGYGADFSILGRHDPNRPSPQQTAYRFSNAFVTEKKPIAIPRLFLNVFSPEHPDSLAFVSTAAHLSPILQTFDLASMAIAQVWKRPELTPTMPEMEAWMRKHRAWAEDIAARGPYNPRMVSAPDWMEWMEDKAGVRLSEHLGWGLGGWRFWYEDRAFCNMLNDGILSPHIYRLFESDRRRAWPGARDEIERVNRNARKRLDDLNNKKQA